MDTTILTWVAGVFCAGVTIIAINPSRSLNTLPKNARITIRAGIAIITEGGIA
jgi:hypothetical protein